MSPPRLAIAAATAALLALAGFGAYRWADDPAHTPPGDPQPSTPRDDTASRAAALEARLAQEAAARVRLERQVARLEEQLTALAERLDERPASRPERPGTRDDDATREEKPPPVRSSARKTFDGAVLLDAGFSPSEAAELRARVDGITMSSLDLWDRATREGWVGTPRFAEEAAAVSREAQLEALRRDVGNDAFDWALFAAGYDNRIRVDSVLADSPAAVAGVRPGDLVVAYANERVFDGGQLVRATTGGRTGELVPVDLQRGSERLAVYVPRGPLGLRVDGIRRPPEPVR